MINFFSEYLPVQIPHPPYVLNDRLAVARINAAIMSLSSHNFSLSEAKEKLTKFAIETATAMEQAGSGWLTIKVRPGKTEKSVRAEIQCCADGDPQRPCKSTFFAPAKMIRTMKGGETLLPAWFVRRALTEVRDRSRYARHAYERVPVQKPRVPDQWRDEYLAHILSQLPSEEEAAIKAGELARIRAESLAAQAEADAKRALALAESRAAAARKAERHATRLASLPRHESVRASWPAWYKKRGRLVKYMRDEDNVTIAISGARAYVLFPDGRQEIVAARNIQILEPAAVEVNAA